MFTFITSLAAVVVVLGIMIVVHEFGHFAVAKLFNVRVEQFAIGFGTRLFGFRKGETDYRVNALPFGGYVKMSGENPLEGRTGDPREFMSHPRWQRFLIALAGPAMNVVLAIGLLTGVYMVRYEHPVYLDEPVVVGWVMENSPAAKAGLQQGDRLIRVDGIQNPTWEDALYKFALSPGQPVDVGIQRGQDVLAVKIVPQKVGPDEIGFAGLEPEQKITITEIEPTMPAAKAGMKLGDEVLALNGVPVHSLPGLIRHLQENKDKPVEVTVMRDHQEKKFSVTPVPSKVDNETYYRMGIQSNPMKVEKLPLAAAFTKSLQDNKRNSLLVLELVQKMVQRKVSMKQMAGPIRIAQASGEAARQPGWTPLLSLMSTISLQLGIFNLFPIPILDGGIILLLILEGLMRRDISLRVKERIYQAAAVFLILFAVMVIYNDIAKTLPGLGRP
jgi:regulator of sigma E protease